MKELFLQLISFISAFFFVQPVAVAPVDLAKEVPPERVTYEYAEPPKKKLLGAVESKVLELKYEQENSYSTKGKYSHKPWTNDGTSDYRVDEWVDGKGVRSYTITRRYQVDVATATGTQKVYQYETYQK